MSPAIAPSVHVRPRQRVGYPAGPFTGMRDSLDPTAGRPELARLLENCYPLDPQFGGAIVGRPGFTLTTGQGGGVGARTGQLIYQLTRLSGTEVTFRIVGGKIEAYDWGADAWSNVVTAANLVTAGITLSTTARCYAVTFNDKVIVTDGVNQPWAWDGTSGAGGLTLLSNAPAVCFGPPTVYYNKLFFIKNAARSSLVWSEENQPNVGYEAGGYLNVWTLGQTDTNALFRLLGTNEALYVFRARSITAIAGAVTPDFSTSGTREGVSETLGTTSPASVYYITNEDGGTRMIFFSDADGKPRAIVPGGGPLAIWPDFRETLSGMDAAQFTGTEGFYNDALDLATFAYRSVAGTNRDAQLLYHLRGDTPQACGVFRGYSWDRAGIVKDASGKPVLMHTDSAGYTYYQGAPDGSVWNDGLQAGTASIRHTVKGPFLGYDAEFEKGWDRLDFTFRTQSDMTALGVRHETPRGVSTTQSTTLSGGFSRFDISRFDTHSFAGDSIDQHLAVGVLGNGRYCSPIISHQASGERFGLAVMKASGFIVGPLPATP